MITEQGIRNVIQKGNPTSLANMCIALFLRQLADEQATNKTKHTNGIGFNKPDSRKCTIIAKYAIKHRNDFQPIQNWMALKLMEKLPKYAGQLAEIANNPKYQPYIKHKEAA